MSDAAGLSRQISVRHKEDGHLRLELPASLCGRAAAGHLVAGLRQQPGIYRVELAPGSRRLSIRFEPLQCSLTQVALHLRGLLEAVPTEAACDDLAATPASDTLAQLRHRFERGAGQVRARIQRLLDGLRQPGAPEGSLQARLQPVLKSALTEKAAINFLNDILMFYLIKVHWDLITKRWMKDPVGHADAWLTTFYLVFLLVRYRKSAK
jgi:hypothetical protein